MKKFTFKGVLDGFRSSVNQQSAAGGGAAKICVEQEIQETLRSEHFQLKKVTEARGAAPNSIVQFFFVCVYTGV